MNWRTNVLYFGLSIVFGRHSFENDLNSGCNLRLEFTEILASNFLDCLHHLDKKTELFHDA